MKQGLERITEHYYALTFHTYYLIQMGLVQFYLLFMIL